MRHEAQVLLVHPHAEGVGGGDHLEAARQEVVLHPRPLGVAHPRVVPPGPQAPALEMRRPDLDVLAGRGVDDAGRPDLVQ